MPELTRAASSEFTKAGPVVDFFLRGGARLMSLVFNDLKVEGTQHIPATGAVIIAPNHPTYLDPIFVICKLERPVRFLGWERVFRIPVIGWVIRQYGAIPVDIDRPGRGSFEAAVKVLKAGEAFGIFPEGGRSDYGTMNPVKSGVARLAMITGAPIVPVTITGAHRVWPKKNLLPRPGPVQVTFHEPIRLSPDEVSARRRDREFEKEIVERVLRSINSSLLPYLRAERRARRALRAAAMPWTGVEALPFLWLAALGVVGEGIFPEAWAVLGYGAYLILEGFLSRRTWSVGLRNFSPWLAAFGAALACGFRPKQGWEHPATVAIGVGLIAGLTWVQLFRFGKYRAWRIWPLAAVYLFLFLAAL